MTGMTPEQKRLVLMRNLGSWLSTSIGQMLTDEDRKYVTELNEAVIERLEHHLGDRFQAVVLPTFLVEHRGQHDAVPVMVEQLRTVLDFGTAVGDLVQQIAGPVLDDEGLTLFVHSPVLPGGLDPKDQTRLDRQRWRTRYAARPGTLFQPQPMDHQDPPSTHPPAERPAGFYPDWNQYTEGTTPAED